MINPECTLHLGQVWPCLLTTTTAPLLRSSQCPNRVLNIWIKAFTPHNSLMRQALHFPREIYGLPNISPKSQSRIENQTLELRLNHHTLLRGADIPPRPLWNLIGCTESVFPAARLVYWVTWGATVPYKELSKIILHSNFVIEKFSNWPFIFKA